VEPMKGQNPGGVKQGLPETRKNLILSKTKRGAGIGSGGRNEKTCGHGEIRSSAKKKSEKLKVYGSA